MKTISEYILVNLLGWKINSDFPDVKKSIIIFAPHTSYWDGFYGKLYFMNTKTNYKFLSKKEFFKFPMKYFFKAFGSIPVFENKEYVNQIAKLFSKNKELHIILSPEGQLAKTRHWRKGFYYIAERANVPIVVGYIDYKKKELGIKGIITENININTTMTEISKMYKDVNAKHPENFSTDKRFS